MCVFLVVVSKKEGQREGSLGNKLSISKREVCYKNWIYPFKAGVHLYFQANYCLPVLSASLSHDRDFIFPQFARAVP